MKKDWLEEKEINFEELKRNLCSFNECYSLRNMDRTYVYDLITWPFKGNVRSYVFFPIVASTTQ